MRRATLATTLAGTMAVATALPSTAGDASRISQVVLNLIRNAQQAVGPHGHIQVFARTAHHAVLGDVLWALRSLGLGEDAQLRIVLLINVAMSVASTWFVFHIARAFSHRPSHALASATVFGFFPALIYYDAFVLSENPTIFAFLLSLHLTVRYRTQIGWLVAGGAGSESHTDETTRRYRHVPRLRRTKATRTTGTGCGP